MFALPHIILMIGDDGIVVSPHNIGNAVPFFVSHDRKSGAQEMIDLIAAHSKARITLVADNLAQDYRTDTLPRLNFFDRRKLAQRRLKQNFPQARLTACRFFKRSPGKILMIGLHDSNPVFVWAEKLRDRLPDIRLLPVEGAKIIARLMPQAASGWAMLISRQKTGGFRQIVTYRNDLVFTRLTPLPDGEDASGIIARDIKASLDYLTRQGLRDASELSVLLLMSGAMHEDAAFQALELQSIRSLSPLLAARDLGLSQAPTEQDDAADLLFAAYMATQLRPFLSLRIADQRQIRQNKILNLWGMRVAAACLSMVIALSLWQAGGLAVTLYRAQESLVQLQQTRNLLAQAQAKAAPVTEPLGRLREALERRHIFEKRAPVPWRSLNELSEAIGSDARIAQLEWRNDNDKEADSFTVSLRVDAGQASDRADIADAFTREAQNIAQAMPDYELSVIQPPFPSLPQETVTVASADAGDPIGKLALQRKKP